jgi:hypothetical protein
MPVRWIWNMTDVVLRIYEDDESTQERFCNIHTPCSNALSGRKWRCAHKVQCSQIGQIGGKCDYLRTFWLEIYLTEMAPIGRIYFNKPYNPKIIWKDCRGDRTVIIAEFAPYINSEVLGSRHFEAWPSSTCCRLCYPQSRTGTISPNFDTVHLQQWLTTIRR